MKQQDTFGHGDPRLDRALIQSHDEAESRGEAFYLDSELELWVQTRNQLKKRGSCCGQGCRHCPYSREHQEKAGRSLLRPEDASPSDEG